MADFKPITEVFESRIRGIAHTLRFYANDWGGFSVSSPLQIDLNEGNPPSINAWRPRANSHTAWQARMWIGNIKPTSGADDSLTYGPITVQKAESLGEFSATFDNKGNPSAVDVDFESLLSKDSSREKAKEKSAGSSVSTTISASAGIEGVGSLDASVTAEIHADISEGSSQSQGQGSEQGVAPKYKVPPNTKVTIFETIAKQDTVQTAYGKPQFTHTIKIGNYHHNHGSESEKFRDSIFFESWQQFKDVMEHYEDAPDNWPLVDALRHRPPYAADLKWALADFDTHVSYDIKREGEVHYDYRYEHVE